MIIFFSDGRLGNQIFQYAFLNTIARKNERIITTNMKSFLNTFDCMNDKFKTYQPCKYQASFIRIVLKRIFYFLVNIRLIGYIKQNYNNQHPLPGINRKHGLFPVTYVETHFFQSESFFDMQKLNFCLKPFYIANAKNILRTIPDTFTKVFVHVRRGDYLFEKYLGDRGIDLPKKYFIRAIKEIKEKVENPYFIFLSDDPHFIECCFEEMPNKYVSRNDMPTDLALMTLCDYGICSNSSFSWWGAYLMQNRKLVLMPKYWYGWKKKVESHVGIQPNWCKIIEI
ncbi:alpha-1,2-fucosyltransferase [Acinetobacter sp. VNH17]|uniref:Alpha-1,2-fucosyltransferase n=1 Tax=Acinetobacter thutiue TaxID=2998078 RepID=A0ABT7WPB4_9GAMM|nr:alpha-1,2-fucosyltransferase [Acinetobacter thutiue]MCY6412414.1 alpha-1,2-fucosyltransferase [Acinetobacter thutiue]MDN0014519.1 alpha-1,2-fucosyltransferase [Acinetobacter thutiue]